jgi:hypothetical protein
MVTIVKLFVNAKPFPEFYMSKLNSRYGRGAFISYWKVQKSGIKLTKTVYDVSVTFWSICFSGLVNLSLEDERQLPSGKL